MVRICLQLLDQRKEEIRQVRTNFQGTPMAGSGYCKTTMLEHKSRTFGVVSTLLRAPFLLFKMDSESQKIPVVMHSDFEVFRV